MAEVTNLNAARADREDDNRLQTPVDCLEVAATNIRSGKTPCDKLVVLRLDTGPEGNHYDVGFNISNMKASEVIALLEVAKMKMLQSMSIVPEG